MKLNRKLLNPEPWYNQLDGTNIKGSYSTMHFVLRLRDDIRRELDNNLGDGAHIQAASTLVHENIHWWQHIGSNFGIILSLANPSMIHSLKRVLVELKGKGLAYKPLVKFDDIYFSENRRQDIKEINFILNNYYDIQNAISFAFDNKNIFEIAEDRRFFLSVGKC